MNNKEKLSVIKQLVYDSRLCLEEKEECIVFLNEIEKTIDIPEVSAKEDIVPSEEERKKIYSLICKYTSNAVQATTIQNMLDGYGYKSMEQIVSLSDERIDRMRNCGKVKKDVIKAVIEELKQ